MKKRMKCLSLLLAMALLLPLVAGCSKSEQKPAEESAAPFRAWIGSETVELDPALAFTPMQQSVILALYEGLMKLDGDENGSAAVVPGIARSYEITENFDGTVSYVFTFRSTARWSDGKRVKADDFVFAWRRLADPDNGFANASLLSAVAGYDEVQETGDETLLQVEAKGSDTFIVTLAQPDDSFLSDVCAAAATVPLRRNVVSVENWPMPAKLTTNGPFQLASYRSDGKIELVRNESYYESRLIAVEKVVLLRPADADAAYALYEQGELDYIYAPTAKQVAEQIAAGRTLHAHSAASVSCVLFNHLTDTFSDARIRRAFDLAVDRGVFAREENATWIPATGFVPYGIANDPESTEDFRTMGGNLCVTDSEKHDEHVREAANLLTASGHYGGAGLDGLRFVYVDSVENTTLALSLQRMWQRALGVMVTLEAVEEENYEERLLEGDYDLALAHYEALSSDAMEFLSLWHSEMDSNVIGYVNTAYDLLLGVSENTHDFSARAAFLHDAESMLLEDSAIVPVCFPVKHCLLNDLWEGHARDAFGRSCFTGLRPVGSAKS